ASQQELDRARLEMELAKLDIDKAEHEHQQNIYKAEREDQTIKLMRIISEFDGTVQEIKVKAGEVIDPQRPAIFVVSNTELWVEVYVPTSISLSLKQGQELDVVYEGEKQTQKAKIFLLDPIVDATSDTQRIRLSMENTAQKPSGLRVEVLILGGKK